MLCFALQIFLLPPWRRRLRDQCGLYVILSVVPFVSTITADCVETCCYDWNYQSEERINFWWWSGPGITPNYYGIEDFNRFVSISDAVIGRFSRHWAKWLTPTSNESTTFWERSVRIQVRINTEISVDALRTFALSDHSLVLFMLFSWDVNEVCLQLQGELELESITVFYTVHQKSFAILCFILYGVLLLSFYLE